MGTYNPYYKSTYNLLRGLRGLKYSYNRGFKYPEPPSASGIRPASFATAFCTLTLPPDMDIFRLCSTPAVQKCNDNMIQKIFKKLTESNRLLIS